MANKVLQIKFRVTEAAAAQMDELLILTDLQSKQALFDSAMAMLGASVRFSWHNDYGAGGWGGEREGSGTSQSAATMRVKRALPESGRVFSVAGIAASAGTSAEQAERALTTLARATKRRAALVADAGNGAWQVL